MLAQMRVLNIKDFILIWYNSSVYGGGYVMEAIKVLHLTFSYDGKNDIFHNGTGEKGTSRFCLKGVGERMDKEGIPKTDWYREVSKTKEL